MLIRGVAVEKFVLHQAGQGRKFGNHSPQNSGLMHGAQNSAYLPLLPKNMKERLLHLFLLGHRLGQKGKSSSHQRLQLSPGNRSLILQNSKDPHHSSGILIENFGVLRLQLRPLKNKSIRCPPRSPPTGKK